MGIMTKPASWTLVGCCVVAESYRSCNSHHMAAFSVIIQWLVLVAVILLIGSSSAGSPMLNKMLSYRPGVPVIPNSGLADECKNGTSKDSGEIEKLCQFCAKSTKSPIVYPMCCTNEEEARVWCDKYVNFGIH